MATEHKLIGDTLYNEVGGIIGRCTCGWSTGHRFSSFAASAAFQDHLEEPGLNAHVPEPFRAIINKFAKPFD